MIFNWPNSGIPSSTPELFDIVMGKLNEITPDPSPERNSLPPGCVICENRDTYDHYGIYAGEKRVIHFTGGEVKITPINKFIEGFGKIDVMAFKNSATEGISLQDSLARAKSKIGTTGYSLLTNNCEHFAIWCRTGKAISTQAFGSRSAEYSNMISRFYTSGANSFPTNFPRIISNIYADEAGMEFSRHVFAKYISDRE